jgi:hypothetical protein
MKGIAVATAVVGGLMFAFGLVRFNSAESQLRRAFGGSDEASVFILIIGGLMVLGGTIAAILESKRTPHATSNSATGQCPNCAKYNYPDANQCAFCGASLSQAKTADRVHSAPASAKPASNSLEELERLAALKERGVLSNEEFEQQKKKILA